MYKIYWCNLGKAVGNPEIGVRPIVSTGIVNGKVKVFQITSRNRDDRYHVRMNHYMIRGFCGMGYYYLIDKKYLLDYCRDCTTSEMDTMNQKIKELHPHCRNKK